MTGQTIIDRAIRKLARLEPAQSAEAGESADALAELQALVDHKNAKRPTLFTVGRSTFTWTADQSSRTIGATGDLVTGRPQWIDRWAVIPSGLTTETVRKRPLSDEEYDAITTKAQTATYFTELYYRPTVPDGTLVVWPVPTSAPTLVLYAPSVLSTFADLTSPYTAARGYEDLFVYELAKRLSAEYGAPWTRTLEELMREARSVVETSTITLPQYGPMPAGLRGHGDAISPTTYDSGLF